MEPEGAGKAEQSRTLLVAMCDALDYAHRQGIVHRFMTLVVAERHFATKVVRAKVNGTAAKASTILTAPTWGVSIWRRMPTSSLLRHQLK
jgi:serine/threonine protein kinase